MGSRQGRAEIRSEVARSDVFRHMKPVEGTTA